jgi:hypothetical protein
VLTLLGFRLTFVSAGGQVTWLRADWRHASWVMSPKPSASTSGSQTAETDTWALADRPRAWKVECRSGSKKTEYIMTSPSASSGPPYMQFISDSVT